mmetsp:Transcript_42724/g.107446  ORF Transcript_42724/g.107446 Transcript_42724/m.107446 type:complete len:136 (-) Transcript_42724:191-598(-)
MPAEVSANTSPSTEFVTASSWMFCGTWQATTEQPSKLKTAAPSDDHRKVSLQISRDSKNVKTEVVEERTVFVATEVYSRLMLNIAAEHSHKRPTVAESLTTEANDPTVKDAVARRGSNQMADVALLNRVTNNGFP